MSVKNVLLGTTALLGASSLFAGGAAAADLEVGLSGFARTLAAFGDLEEESGVADSREFYFRNDVEVHVNVRGTDDETGLRYGATVEFEGDTDAANNTDETWLFIEGGFGGIRLGDEDGAFDNMKLGAESIAAGTGGLDGAGEVVSAAFTADNSSDATKIRYDSPVVGGFQLGISYTPDSGHGGASSNPTDNGTDREDWVEAGLVYSGAFSGVDLKASAVGSIASYESGVVGDDDFSAFQIGAVVGFSGISVAGAYWAEDDDVGGDRDGWNIGAAAGVGPANVSVNYAFENQDATGNEPENFVVSADVTILPGVALQGDVSFFDRDAGGDDDGVTGVVRMQVAF